MGEDCGREFKAGDVVKVIKPCSGAYPGKEYTLTKGGLKLWTTNDDGQTLCSCQGNWEFVREGSVDIKSRINGLTCWDKEADDILMEVSKRRDDLSGSRYRFVVDSYGAGGMVAIVEHGSGLSEGERTITVVKSFSFNNQCGKLAAFKDGLLWLANEENDKETKKLKAEIAELRSKIDVLEAKL